MATNWHDDRDSFRDAKTDTWVDVLQEQDVEDILEMGEGHWIESGRVWGRPESAWNWAKREIPRTANYLKLIKMYNDEEGTIEWAIFIVTDRN